MRCNAFMQGEEEKRRERKEEKSSSVSRECVEKDQILYNMCGASVTRRLLLLCKRERETCICRTKFVEVLVSWRSSAASYQLRSYLIPSISHTKNRDIVCSTNQSMPCDKALSLNVLRNSLIISENIVKFVSKQRMRFNCSPTKNKMEILLTFIQNVPSLSGSSVEISWVQILNADWRVIRNKIKND